MTAKKRPPAPDEPNRYIAEAYAAAVYRLMPGAKQQDDRREAEAKRQEELREAAVRDMGDADFLVDEVKGYFAHYMLPLREVVALSCGIDSRFAWVIGSGHDVESQGLAKVAAEKARHRLKYLCRIFSVQPDEEVAFEFVVSQAERIGWDLPKGFPRLLAGAASVKPGAVTSHVINDGGPTGQGVTHFTKFWFEAHQRCKSLETDTVFEQMLAMAKSPEDRKKFHITEWDEGSITLAPTRKKKTVITKKSLSQALRGFEKKRKT